MAEKRFLNYEGLLNFTRQIASKFVKAADFLAHKGDTTAHTTSTDKSHLNTAYTHSQAAHAPADAQKNTITGVKGNAETSYRIGNVNLTPANIGAAPTTHNHTKSQITDMPTTLPNPASLKVQLNGGTTEGTNQFTYTGSAAKNVNITPGSIGAATSGHGHSAATTSAAGYMSAADKTKLNGIASGANKYILPTASKDVLGGVKTTSTVESASGYTAAPIISGVVYYKDTNTTYSNMKGATADAAGSAGLVPAPAAGKQGSVLYADGTWKNLPDYTLNSFGITASANEINCIKGATSSLQTQINTLFEKKSEIWNQASDPSSEWGGKQNIPLTDTLGSSILDSTGSEIGTIFESDKYMHNGDMWHNSTNHITYYFKDGNWIEMPVPNNLEIDSLNIHNICVIDDEGIKLYQSANNYILLSPDELCKWEGGVKYPYKYFNYTGFITLSDSNFEGGGTEECYFNGSLTFTKSDYGNLFPDNLFPDLNNVQMYISSINPGLDPANYSGVGLYNMTVEPTSFTYNSLNYSWVLQYTCKCSYLTYGLDDGEPTYVPPSNIKISYNIQN